MGFLSKIFFLIVLILYYRENSCREKIPPGKGGVRAGPIFPPRSLKNAPETHNLVLRIERGFARKGD
jgi:hypothetical protein